MLMDQTAYANRLRFMHPGEKAAFAVLCMTAALVARSPVVPILCTTVITLVALGPARIPAKVWIRLCLIPAGFLLAGGLSLALEISHSTGPWFLHITRQTSVGVTEASLMIAFRVTARSLGCSVSLIFLGATTPLTDLNGLLRRLHVPIIICELLTITYRALFILLETAAQMQRAQASRLGYCSLHTSLGSLGAMSARLFGRSLERAELSWRALLSRGYDQELLVLSPEYQVSNLRMLAGASLGLGLLVFAVLLPGGR